MRVLRLLLLVLAIPVVESTPLDAQVVPLPQGPIRVTPPTFELPAINQLVAAMSPAGGWVAAFGNAYRFAYIPQEMEAKLAEYYAAGTPIDAVAFTPDGNGWVLVTETSSFVRNVGGSGSNVFDAVLRFGLARGKRVRALAFNPAGWETDRGYVILWRDGTVSSRAIPTEMSTRLTAFMQDNAEFRSVAFTPSGGWTIVTSKGSFTRNVAGLEPNYFTRLTALETEGRLVNAVGFNPIRGPGDLGWFSVSPSQIEIKNLPGNFRADLARLMPGRAITDHSAPAAAFDAANPVVTVLIHGKTDYPASLPAERIGTLAHSLHYWGFNFVWGVLGEVTVFDGSGNPFPGRTLYSLQGSSIADRNWSPRTSLSGATHAGHFLTSRPYSASGPLPANMVMLTYRDGSQSLPIQTREAINQIYTLYQAQFGQSAVKPDLVLVGHSMGGLVARYMLTNPSGAIAGVTLDPETRRRADFIRNHTRYLVTLASPHEGSPIPATSRFLDANWSTLVDSFTASCTVAAAAVAGAAAPLGIAMGAACLGSLRSSLQEARKDLNADMDAMRHLTPEFWQTLNTGALAPHLAMRTDGSRIPIYSMGGRSSAGQLGLDHDLYESRKAIPGGFWSYLIEDGCLADWLPAYPNCRQRSEGVALMFVDWIVSSGAVPGIPTHGYRRANGDSRLDQVRRSWKKDLTLWPMAEPRERPESLPLLYFRGWQDDVVDSDGFVGLDSSIGFRLGTATNEYFANGQCWNVSGVGTVRGSWYRVFDSRYPRNRDNSMRDGSSRQSFPWDWSNHGDIHHRAGVGQWLYTHLIAQAGPWVGPANFSSWSRGGIGC
jgi:hypothetical protein